MSKKVSLEKCSSCDSGNADNKSNEDVLLKAKGSTSRRAVNAWIVKMEKIPDSKTLIAGSRRHRFIFVYYCDIRLFLPISEAVKKVEALNARFTEPLSEKELHEIIESVDQRHEYDSSVFHFDFVIVPDYKYPAAYADCLRLSNPKKNQFVSLDAAIGRIKLYFEERKINKIYAYNAPCDRKNLPQLNGYEWYDVVRIAAYRQYNKYLPDDLPYFGTGRLKKGYKLSDIYKYVIGIEFSKGISKTFIFPDAFQKGTLVVV